MKLWLISQSENDGYDTFYAAVVAAEYEDDARLIHPYGDYVWHGDAPEPGWYRHGADLTAPWQTPDRTWAPPAAVTVKLIGEAVEGTAAGVVLASFNAG